MPEAAAPVLERAKPIQRGATGTDTVVVACNLPNGLILQIYDVEVEETVLPNGRVIKENVSTLNLEHGQYALNGMVEFSTLSVAGREVPDYRVIKGSAPGTGYALTTGIPRDFWERWLHDNERNPIVLNRHVFAQGTEARAVANAREFKDFKSGFQGLSQQGDSRVPRGIRRFDRQDNQATPDADAAE